MITTVEEPGYKLLTQGHDSLTDIEVIAGIISSDDINSSLEKVRNLLSKVTIWDLGKISAFDLDYFGFSKEEATRLLLTLELGRRRNMTNINDRPKINSSRDAYNVIADQIKQLIHEEFWLLVMNKANEVVNKVKLSSGGWEGTVVDIKMLFKLLLNYNGVGFICVHNHPSGNLQPSQADIELTRRIRKAGDIMNIILLDHLIISERGYYSFADEGML